MSAALVPVAEIAEQLNRSAERLVLDLLPAGKRMGREWRVGGVDGSPGGSLLVNLAGGKIGRWHDFHGGEGGDMLDLIAAVRYHGNKRDAIAWAMAWLGLSDAAGPDARRPLPPPAPVVDDAEEEAKRSAFAVALFLEAQPALAGTPGAAYLAARGIDLAQLGRQPRALRFHPRLYNTESRSTWPAMVAAVCNAAGEHVATHRTWLWQKNGRWTKAPLHIAKKAIGSMRGGSIRLWRGASRKALRDAPEGDVVAIAEGIETALSVAIACPELRVLAAGWVDNLRSIELPPTIGRVIICADNDEDNPDTERAVQRAVSRYQAEGRDVHVAMPTVPGADWNDILQGVEG